ncbi:MAG: HDOD domain-containing protein, partial [Pseudomonadales bacterium]|nr:HDOD domain-containing protein [Pseudomonadales bacterium]NIX07300.1 HDOD domain-containing protein [Pseudomonadales bacterium]
LATGCVSQFLATELRGGDPEEAFTAGLLHDIGRPLMDQALGEQYAEAIGLVN